MPTGKDHPHAEMPDSEALREVIARVHPQHEAIYLGTHDLVLEAVPDTHYSVDLVDGSIGYGARQFGYGGWGMAALSPHRGWVSLFFMKGVQLSDPEGLLEGSGKLMRHVKLRSVEALEQRAGAIQALLTAASRLPGE
jgi:hypothetical protein